MMSINDAAPEYAELYGRRAPALGAPQDDQEDAEEGAGVKDVLYALMSEGDKLPRPRRRFAASGPAR